MMPMAVRIQTLKPQMKLRGFIGGAHKICEDAGKLGLPQATDNTERLCGCCFTSL